MKRRKIPKLDPPGTHYSDSKNIVIRSMVGTDSYTTWRENLRNLLKRARNSCAEQWRRFGYGILYDAVGWTPDRYAHAMYEALLECGVLLAKKKFGEKDLRTIRDRLQNAGFNLVPE